MKMMEIIRNRLKNKLNIRTEKDFPKEGIEFIDIMPMIMNKDIFNEIIDKIKLEIENKKVDYIISPEARGFLLGPVLANKLQVGFVPVRKSGKMPTTTVEYKFMSEKEYGKDELELPKLIDDSYKGKKFYIVDDIYATGNTVKAIQKAIKTLGGDVVGQAVIMNIIELNNDKNIFSLLEVNET